MPYHLTLTITNRLITDIRDEDLKIIEKLLPEYSIHYI